MYRFAGRFVSTVIVLCCLVSMMAVAQQKSDGSDQEASIRQIVDGILKPFLSEHHIPGAIVGVSIRGKSYFFAYGKATDAGDPFTADTLVEIGSCTKTFTTTLFALALNRSQMLADASAQKYMPSRFTLRPRAQLVTPLELADFTSGMPDDPTNLPSGPLWKRNIEHYTTDDFLKWVSHWAPTSNPPAPYLYSNAGIGLLSYLIADATGKQWEDQLNAEIVRPLNLQDTTLRPLPNSASVCPRGTILMAAMPHPGQSLPGMPREGCVRQPATCCALAKLI